MLKILSPENWKTTLLVLIAVPLLLKLGFWQLDRAEQKRSLQAAYEVSRAAEPLGEPGLLADSTASLAYRRVRMQGQYLASFNALLDNQIEDGRAGYHLLTPFATASAVYWVNRGWLPANKDRSLPELSPPPARPVFIEASIYIPQGEPVTLTEDSWGDGWPIRVQSVDMPGLVERLGSDADQPVFPMLLRLERGYPGGLSIDWQIINTQPEKHTGYAVQWFAMTIALLAFWLYTLMRETTSSQN